ncbi:hypothetical protein Y032_0418g1119 [Ancylostoma ceylanicum]|uniref:Uncharacterized protein n=1 Tax=Ancylostoma ceylanicum TaxID=53326 RepID=A0A016X2H9_9BILA|nr:hypothetical protein Y032_0418g1119 [Ancylostoma ceylanicum]
MYRRILKQRNTTVSWFCIISAVKPSDTVSSFKPAMDLPDSDEERERRYGHGFVEPWHPHRRSRKRRKVEENSSDSSGHDSQNHLNVASQSDQSEGEHTNIHFLVNHMHNLASYIPITFLFVDRPSVLLAHFQGVVQLGQLFFW